MVRGILDDVVYDSGSFRDPSGQIFTAGQRVFRKISTHGKEAYEAVRACNITTELEKEGMLIESKEVTDFDLPSSYKILEHPRIPFISYPYEWSFEQLRNAALLHISLHLKCLERNITLSDASAYNVQFNGYRPVFIDRLSLIPYRDGDAWHGHRQFTEHFIAPLLWSSYLNLGHQELYRAHIDGIPLSVLSKSLPWTKKTSFNYYMFIHLLGQHENKSYEKSGVEKMRKLHLPKDGLVFILNRFKKWIERLPSVSKTSFWNEYKDFRSYQNEEVERKKEFVSAAVNYIKPGMLWDIGCNSGEFSDLAIEAGAKYVVGFETDKGALENAFQFSRAKSLPFLPLYIDICNPSPSQGWAESERKGLKNRVCADMVLSLAVLHHMAIGNNVPLKSALDYILSLAPYGIIEWVPKEDPMVRRMLALRKDIFEDYSHDAFVKRLRERTEILKETIVSSSGRILYFYKVIN